jgi:hemin uptake protein HemP
MRTIIVIVNLDLETKPSTPLPAFRAPRKVASETLLGLGRELVILHNGREYRLRVTQNGKLILTA